MRKGIITLGVIAIVVFAMMGIGPVVMNFFTDRGLQTADITAGGAPASVEVDGTWEIVRGAGANHTQAGYTFDEKLPAGSKTTSGRTDNAHADNVTGTFLVSNETLEEGEVEVDVASITSDNEKRDINVREDILLTDRYPHATFTLTKPVDVSDLPADGTTVTKKVTGDLTLMNERKEVSTDLKVLRTGEHVIISGNIPFARSDFDIKTPEFVASSIANEGTIDLLLVLHKIN
ncbi:MAG TPA: YceI family protein [Candidatus Corynebacterium gallistercoris]|uniref:YceI family protein n=1 Tax=Candidatus Corynebacterium gallistercoris TaxID=2838530 RepID=A0A9D1RYE7_9CORY|nr:YceI family protein [Candidatus Corynebacterium gallistercoris]